MNNHRRTLPTITYYPSLNAITGSPRATIFLCQLTHWSRCTNDPDGWVHKTREELEEELGFTRRNQETARKKLRDRGILEEELRGLPARLHFRVNWATLEEMVAQMATSKTEGGES